MRDRLQRLWYWLTAQSPNLTFDQKLQRWVNVTAAIGVVVTVGGWLVGWALNLPWFVGLLVGLAAWVVILNGFVTFGRRSAPAKDSTPSTVSRTEDDPSSSPPPTDPIEVKELKRRLADTQQQLTTAQQQIHKLQEEKKQLQDTLREAEQAPEDMAAENQRLREKLAKRDADRTAFRGMLIAAHSEGASLRESKPNKTDAREWASRVSDLIEAALGDWQVKQFWSDESIPAPHDLDATSEQNWMYYRLTRLQVLIRHLESPANFPIKPGFDPANESLKRRCREVAEDLFQFLDDYKEQNEDEIKELYRRRLRGRVKALLRDLEQQAWWPPETLPSFRRNAVENPLTPYSIGSLADFLNEIGHRQ
jgi:hypothetical protein